MDILFSSVNVASTSRSTELMCRPGGRTTLPNVLLHDTGLVVREDDGNQQFHIARGRANGRRRLTGELHANGAVNAENAIAERFDFAPHGRAEIKVARLFRSGDIEGAADAQVFADDKGVGEVFDLEVAQGI